MRVINTHVSIIPFLTWRKVESKQCICIIKIKVYQLGSQQNTFARFVAFSLTAGGNGCFKKIGSNG